MRKGARMRGPNLSIWFLKSPSGCGTSMCACETIFTTRPRREAQDEAKHVADHRASFESFVCVPGPGTFSKAAASENVLLVQQLVLVEVLEADSLRGPTNPDIFWEGFCSRNSVQVQQITGERCVSPQ